MQDSLLLMVEDEALTALSLQDALEIAGFVVLHASDGHEAFVFLQDHQGKLAALITDIRFGNGLNGWAVARKARELNAAIPVLYISGDSAHEHAQLGVGRSIMLQKPFTPDRLLATLRSLLPPSNAKMARVTRAKSRFYALPMR